HIVEHRLQRLLGERRVAQRVAGAIEANHEAVADDLVLAQPPDVGDVLDADRSLRGGRGEHEEQRKQEPDHHPSTTFIVPSGWTMPFMMTPVSVLRTGMSVPAAPDCIADPYVTIDRPRSSTTTLTVAPLDTVQASSTELTGIGWPGNNVRLAMRPTRLGRPSMNIAMPSRLGANERSVIISSLITSPGRMVTPGPPTCFSSPTPSPPTPTASN